LRALRYTTGFDEATFRIVEAITNEFEICQILVSGFAEPDKLHRIRNAFAVQFGVLGSGIPGNAIPSANSRLKLLRNLRDIGSSRRVMIIGREHLPLGIHICLSTFHRSDDG
jgi:hypothetical protein